MSKVIQCLFIIGLVGCNQESNVEFSSINNMLILKGNMTLDFGEVIIGESKSLDYEIRNLTNLSVEPGSFKLMPVKMLNTQNSSPFKLELGTCTEILKKLNKCSVKITYTPEKKEIINTRLKIFYKYSSVLNSNILIENVHSKGIAPFTAKFSIYGSDLNLNLRLNSSYTYNFMVHWGDGTSGVVTSSSDLDKNHTYSSSGTYIVKITGRCPYLNFRDSEQIIEVTELGDTGWESFSHMFNNADNLTLVNGGSTRHVTNMSSMFLNAALANPDTSDWDTSKVTDMRSMFYSAALANPDTSNWDTSNVTYMNWMFSNTALANPDTSNWDTSKVTDMRWMFSNTALANPDTSNWDTSKVTSMNWMFYNAALANPDTSNWDTSNVTYMSHMFFNADLANPDTSNWDTSKVTDMNSMFSSTALANPDTSNWDTSKVTDMNSMFSSADLANPDTSDWDTSKVTDMRSMFNNAALANPDTSDWDTSKVTDMRSMFNNAALANPDTSNWDTSKVTDMRSMFNNAALANPDTSNWDTSKVTDMSWMFSSAASFDQDISSWNVSNVVECNSFSYQTLTSWTLAEKPNFTRCSPDY